MRRLVLALPLALLLPFTAHAVDVTACGQVVPTGETGVLQADLTTCGPAGVGVFVEDRGTLDLNDHVISSGVIGVHCLGKRCTVHGPGTVTGTGLAGIQASAENVRLTVADVVANDNAVWGIVTMSGKSRMRLARVQANGNRSGIETNAGGSIVGEDIEASNNRDYGIFAGKRFKLKRVTVLDTGATEPGPFDIGVGCISGNGTLVDSTVTGSAGFDVGTARKPRIVRTTCGTSMFVGGNPTWGVCAND